MAEGWRKNCDWCDAPMTDARELGCTPEACAGERRGCALSFEGELRQLVRKLERDSGAEQDRSASARAMARFCREVRKKDLEIERRRGDDWLRVAENHAEIIAKIWYSVGEPAHEMETVDQAVARLLARRAS